MLSHTRLTTALALGTVLSCSLSTPARADSLWESARNEVQHVWDDGTLDAYLPLNTYHMRWAYSKEKIAEFNENPWGFGLGRSLRDDNDNWHALYAMAFLDSHKEVEPIVGYAYTHPFARAGEWRAEIGYTAFITSRTDTLHSFPFPGVLPLVGLSYGKLTINSTYIPGGKGNGNVLFTFAHYHF